jgi:hypothetical protein
MAFARTIVEDKAASAVIDSEAAKHPRLRELFDGLTWLLARDSEAGYPVPGTDPQLWVIHSDEWPGIPATIVLAYYVTENNVTIRALTVLYPSVAGALGQIPRKSA